MKSFQAVRESPWLAWLFAILGGGAFFVHLWTNARTQQSVIDEGLYLMKGLLFTSGRYVPFQDGGPWTNHMPVSFLIPGWVQQIFEPGYAGLMPSNCEHYTQTFVLHQYGIKSGPIGIPHPALGYNDGKEIPTIWLRVMILRLSEEKCIRLMHIQQQAKGYWS